MATTALLTTKPSVATDAAPTTTVSPSASTLPVGGKRKLFMIAGQSNAEGNVDVKGLSKIASAFATIPGASEGLAENSLSASHRQGVRDAIQGSQGNICKSDVYKDVQGDNLIDRMLGLSVDWAKFTDAKFEDKRVTINSANFGHSAVTLATGLAGRHAGQWRWCAGHGVLHGPVRLAGPPLVLPRHTLRHHRQAQL